MCTIILLGITPLPEQHAYATARLTGPPRERQGQLAIQGADGRRPTCMGSEAGAHLMPAKGYEPATGDPALHRCKEHLGAALR